MEQLEEARRDMKTAVTKISDLSSASANASSQLESVGSQMVGLQNDLDKVRQASEDQKTAHSKKVADLQAEGESLLEAMHRKHDAELQEKVRVGSEQLRELRTELKHANQEVQSLQEQLAGLNDGDAALRTRIEKAQQERIAALDKAEELFKHSDDLDQQLQKLRSEHQQLQVASRSNEASLAEHLQDVQKQRHDAVDEVNELRSTCQALRQQLQQASQAREAAGTGAEKRMTEARSEIEQLKATCDSLSEELSNAEQAAAGAAEARQKIEQLQSTIQSLQQASGNSQQVASPSSIMPRMHSAQGTSANVTENVGQLRSIIETLGQQLASTKPGASALNSSDPGNAIEETVQLRMSVDSLTHELEMTKQVAAAAGKTGSTNTHNVVSVIQERTAAAEQTQALNTRIDTLSQQLQQARDDGPSSARSGGSPSKDAPTQVCSHLFCAVGHVGCRDPSVHIACHADREGIMSAV